MVLHTKIEAIKALRAMAHNIHVEQNDRAEWVIRPGSGLKDAKDLVEAIMELGKQEAGNEVTRLRNRVQAAINEDIRF